MIERYTLPKMLKVWSEESKFEKMLQIELLSCEGWFKLGKIPSKSLTAIKARAKIDIEKIKELEEKTRHDVVAFVNNLSESVGQDAKYIHMGLTSNDILDTTLALQMAQAFDILIDDVERLLSSLVKLAKKYKSTPCVGRTHGVHAEPTTFGLKAALWYDETRRDLESLKEAQKLIAVGKLSGTIGTYTNIAPEIEKYVCEKLGLGISYGSTQVIPRDRHAACMTRIAITGASLERFATEIRHLQRTEVMEVEEPFGKGQKGSSAMPHKRNPVMCERICGLARLLRSNALAEIENMALWHERDISHSSVERVILPDSTLILDYILNQFIEVVDGLNVNTKNMLINLGNTRGLIYSQRVLLELMSKGLARPIAYDIVQKNAFEASSMNKDFKTALLSDPKVKRVLSASEIEACFDIKFYLRHIPAIFKNLGLE
ncbi:MAG: adenylosuccinate lyase [Candidatus Omnitrophica bacterium CG1_02_44_16]|nr:MAG: adenylosuccinate lyase [Candidatus Omnitrophica bacterium CG1_02_44_16]PIY83366.1 MAG: adenylosuccinate lyase [Candidatus Omnitrophica bacterium CG_4_10_14_0_8_um_filter_44_12]PIZ84348.1 MAG: adenylosuccinate lyase [Candidatus Omnitrophica bacterium CG_4_10_14_0_2_um_filter_44_9]